jgi:succinate dehydrogenase/fumarate reductase cytochrome b subunit
LQLHYQLLVAFPIMASSITTTTWRKLQAASGLIFGIFLVLHWISHISLLLLGSLEAGNETLHRMRSIYQSSPFSEANIALALVLHLISNTVLYLRRGQMEQNAAAKKQDDDKKSTTTASSSSSPASAAAPYIPGSLEHKAHRYAGYLLSIFVFGHVLATRIAPRAFLNDQQYSKHYDYAAISLVFDHYRLQPKFLMFFAMAANWHFVYGMRSALTTLLSNGRSSVTGTPFPIPLKTVVLSLHIFMIGSILALTGSVYGMADIQKVYPEKFEAFRVWHNGIQSTLGLSNIIPPTGGSSGK